MIIIIIIIIVVIIIIMDLHLIMGQKHLIWDRVWDVKSRKSNLYLHIQYIYMMHLWFYFFMRTHWHRI